MPRALSNAIKPVLAMIVLLLGIIGKPAPVPATEELPVIVASTTQIADFARQIGGDAVDYLDEKLGRPKVGPHGNPIP